MKSAGEKGTSTSNVTVQGRDEFDDAGGVVIGSGVDVEDVLVDAIFLHSFASSRYSSAAQQSAHSLH